MNEETQDTVTITTEQDTELEENLDTAEDSVTLTKAEHEALTRKANAVPNILARAHKAEEALKNGKSVSQEVSTDKPFSRQEAEELLLKSQGVDDKRIENLRTIARAKGVGMLDAQKDELYIALDSKLKADEKAQKATLGASKGSGRGEAPKKDNLTRDEHQEQWRKSIGQ